MQFWGGASVTYFKYQNKSIFYKEYGKGGICPNGNYFIPNGNMGSKTIDRRVIEGYSIDKQLNNRLIIISF